MVVVAARVCSCAIPTLFCGAGGDAIHPACSSCVAMARERRGAQQQRQSADGEANGRTSNRESLGSIVCSICAESSCEKVETGAAVFTLVSPKRGNVV